ncbi:hypothetical protein Pelo_2292 [Pelomyxa schiedti]|nr:hypothetical protein Pelo_2292 [Pelomyxa schiedti]
MSTQPGNADMPPHPQQASAILFDLVAACLAKGEPYTALVDLQPMHIVVTPEGLTLPSDSPTPTCTPTTTSQCTTHPGNAVVATSWLNQASFTHHAALCLSNHHLC